MSDMSKKIQHAILLLLCLHSFQCATWMRSFLSGRFRNRVGLQAVLVGSAGNPLFSHDLGGAGNPCDKGFKTSILQQLEKIRLPTRIASKSFSLKAKKHLCTAFFIVFLLQFYIKSPFSVGKELRSFWKKPGKRRLPFGAPIKTVRGHQKVPGGLHPEN